MTGDWSAVASESRVKYLDIVQSHYPYILNVEYRVDDKGSMFYPTWVPVGDEKQGIKSSTFIVSDPQNVGFRYRNGNVAEPKYESEGTGSRYTWELLSRSLSPENWRTCCPWCTLHLLISRWEVIKGIWRAGRIMGSGFISFVPGEMI